MFRNNVSPVKLFAVVEISTSFVTSKGRALMCRAKSEMTVICDRESLLVLYCLVYAQRFLLPLWCHRVYRDCADNLSDGMTWFVIWKSMTFFRFIGDGSSYLYVTVQATLSSRFYKITNCFISSVLYSY